MITTDTEFYSSPYYFLLRDKGNKYSLYYSVEENLNEARKKDEVIHFEKSKGDKVKKHLKNLDHKIHRGVVVVKQNHLIHRGSLQSGLGFFDRKAKGIIVMLCRTILVEC